MKTGNTAGVVFSEPQYTVVKKLGEKGGTIPAHTHEEAFVVFTPVKGRIDLCVDGQSKVVEPGEVITWDGVKTIQATYLEDSEVFVTLIKKQ